MIHNEKEYIQAVNRLAEEHARLSLYRKRLTEEGLSAEAVQRVDDPMESFHLQLKEEVESYERLKRRECDWPALEILIQAVRKSTPSGNGRA